MRNAGAYRAAAMLLAFLAVMMFIGVASLTAQQSGVGEGEENLEVGPGGGQRMTPEGQDTGVEAGRRDPGQPGAASAESPQARVDQATSTLQDMLSTRENRIPPEVVRNARAVAVFPNMTKAGLIVGGRYGTGVLMIKQQNEWNGPLFLSIYGASIGAQVGVERSDLIMVFNNPDALRDLQDGTLEFGAEASVAAGPLGEKVKASTEADVLAYHKTRGGFAGISLSTGYIDINTEANDQYFKSGEGETRAYYPSVEEMISGSKAPETEAARQLSQVLDQYGSQAQQ